MRPEGKPVHVGINYVFSPPPDINRKQSLEFQKHLIEGAIEFGTIENIETEIKITRTSPLFQIRVISNPNAPVGQLLIIAPNPEYAPDYFGREAEAVVGAFNKTWTTPSQIIACDSTIRYLYESSGEHAFKELWETKLGQSKNSLAAFGRDVLGGGFRFVMPPMPDEINPTQVEVKIESFLQDTSKILIDVEFKWVAPQPIGSRFDPLAHVNQVDNYIENQVKNFLMGREQ